MKTVEGHFTFDENLDFYKGHFEHHPVTPGYLNRDNGSDRISLSWYIYIR
jgi:3-hydroxymyristoyl/3-hydroxydecanoyl-(acyl carrier protein) dehydratase